MLAVLCLVLMNEDRRKQGAENEQHKRIGTQGVQGGICDKYKIIYGLSEFFTKNHFRDGVDKMQNKPYNTRSHTAPVGQCF